MARFKRVMRLDHQGRVFRICRWIWERGVVGDGNGYSAKLSLGLEPRVFRWERSSNSCRVTILGLRLHYRRAYGGRFA